nr:hypothetical protein [Armatimonadota bacterium]
DPERAVDLTSTAIGLNPLDGSLRLLRGQAEIQAARSTSDPSNGRDLMERARTDLETAARLMPASAAPLYPLGALWKAGGNLQAAADAYRQAITRDPHAMGAALDLADLETLLHHPAAARDALERVAGAEDTPFATIRGVPEAFDSHYAQAWAGLAHLDGEAGQWTLSATEAERALKDMDIYAKLAGQFIRLEAVMTMYSPEGRTDMKRLEGQAYGILRDDLKHLNQTSRLPEVEERHQQFIQTLDNLKDPS